MKISKTNDNTCAMKMVMSLKDIFSCDIHFKLTETTTRNFSYLRVPARLEKAPSNDKERVDFE